MASIFDYFRKDKTATEQPPEENRSYTYGGPVVTNWDTVFSYGKNIDKISVAFGCMQLRSSTIASLPIQLNQKLERGYKPAVDHPYYNLITKSPNQFQTPFSFWCWAVVQLDMYGNCYIQKIRNGRGEVLELMPLNPSSVEVEIRADGLPFYKMTVMTIDGKSMQQDFTNDQIIHIKAFSRNGVFGLSVIDNFRTLFDGYSELETAGTAIAKNAAKPNGVIYHPGNVKEEELGKLKASWSTGFNGVNAGKSAWLPNTFKVEGIPSSMTAQQAEYISQKNFSAQRIVADIFGCPLHRFGLSASPTYASVEQSALEFVNWTLAPIITNIEQTIQKQLLEDSDEVYVNFDVKGLLRGDISTRINYYKFGRDSGIFTANDVHLMEDTGIVIPPEKGGDDLYMPVNYAAIGKPVVPVVRETMQVSGSATPVVQ